MGMWGVYRMIKTPITKLKQNPLAKRFFKDLGDETISIVTKFGSIHYESEDTSTFAMIGEGTTRKANIIAAELAKLGYVVEDIENGEFTIQINNKDLLECAKILGAKEKKVMSDEQKQAAAERLRKLKQENN